jgi:cell wall assembly regulator SMI1
MAEDITPRWDALKCALAAIDPAILANLHPGADDERIARLHAGARVPLPADLEALYRENDGEGRLGFDFQSPAAVFSVADPRHASGANDYWFMPIDGPDGVVAELTAFAEAAPYRAESEWMERSGPVRAHSPGWIPFAKDFGGNFLCLDLDPESGGTRGQIIEVAYDDSRIRVVASGLAELLEDRLRRLR